MMIVSPMPAAATVQADAMYALDDVGFQVDGCRLLQPLSLQLSRQRMYGLIGHNGSGKSTLLKLLARQLTPSSGQIRFAGRALNDWSGREFARKVAYLPQQPPPTEGMTVRELVGLGRYPWHGLLGRFGQRDRDKVEAALELTDMAGLGQRLVANLSGGEVQRAWLAMLVAQDSDCLLLDEPISALDIAHQLEVLQLVRRLSEQHGLGVVLVLHDINMAGRFCDEIIALKAGSLLARGAPQEIIRSDRLAAIYGIPMGTVANPDGGSPIGYAH